MRLKIDWTSLLLGRKFTVFICFTLYLTEISKYKPPGWAYIWRGDLTEVFCVTSLGGLYLEGLIDGGAYFEFNWKTNLFAKRVRTNIGRVTAKTYSGDRHFHNVRYFNILNV